MYPWTLANKGKQVPRNSANNLVVVCMEREREDCVGTIVLDGSERASEITSTLPTLDSNVYEHHIYRV